MKKIILITGISSGFGKETASLLAQAGHTVYGTVRQKVGADPLVNELLMDLTDSKSIDAAAETVIKNEGRIDVLINNAGMHTGGPVETLPLEIIQLQIQTNFLGLVQLTQAVLPVMRKQGSGTIINLSSIGGLMGLPYQGIYSSMKFAVEGFSEALRMEVKQFNINIIVINPGDFHTCNSMSRRGFLSPTSERDPYHAQFARTLSIIENDENKGWEPKILAKRLVRIIGCKNPKHRYIIASAEQKLAVVLKLILPGKLFSMLLRNHYGIK
jgi:NAD(P)-dependent dehydrogenase (short-subunit alcohol dehydrogenase family)